MKLGVGLFDNATANDHLTDEAEQNILLFLVINDLIVCAILNQNPWSRRMTEEIKRREACVTVYTWPSATISSEVDYRDGTATRGRFGHSALKTYSGGSDGKGMYVSFYPGDCDRNNRTPSCHKAVSHFHKWSQDNRGEAEPTDLCGLDIEAFNHAFQALHDDMNSNKAWSSRYNCSDVALELLEKSELFSKLGHRRYNTKSLVITVTLVSAISVISVTLISNTIYWRGKTLGSLNIGLVPLLQRTRDVVKTCRFSLWFSLMSLQDYTTSNIGSGCFQDSFLLPLLNKLVTSAKPTLLSEMSDPFPYHLGLLEKDKFLSTVIISTATGMLTGSLTSYMHSIYASHKSMLPFYIRNKNAKSDAIKASLLCGSLILLEIYMKESIRNQGITPPIIFPLDVISKYIYFPLLKKVLPHSQASLFIIMSMPIAPIILFVSFKSFYDTTTTPNHVLKLANSAESELKILCKRKNKEEVTSFPLYLSKKLYENKTTALTIGGLLALSGFCMFKGRRMVHNGSSNNIVKLSNGLTF